MTFAHNSAVTDAVNFARMLRNIAHPPGPEYRHKLRQFMQEISQSAVPPVNSDDHIDIIFPEMMVVTLDKLECSSSQ